MILHIVTPSGHLQGHSSMDIEKHLSMSSLLNRNHFSSDLNQSYTDHTDYSGHPSTDRVSSETR